MGKTNSEIVEIPNQDLGLILLIVKENHIFSSFPFFYKLCLTFQGISCFETEQKFVDIRLLSTERVTLCSWQLVVLHVTTLPRPTMGED